MNMLIFSIFPLNKGDLATFTLAPPFCCNRVATCCCRPAIRVRSCSFWIKEAWDIEIVDCSIGCCWYCWNMCTGGSNGNDNEVSLYKDKQSSLSELMTSYQLEE